MTAFHKGICVGVFLAVTLIYSMGCAATGSKELAVGCHVFDGVTTHIALNKGAIEANPLMASVIDLGGMPLFWAVKIGVAYLIYKGLKQAQQAERRSANVAGTVHNALICGAGVNNVNVIQGLP